MAETDSTTDAGETRRTRAAAAATPRSETLEDQVAQLQADIRTITETLTKMGSSKLDEARATAQSRAQKVLADAQNEFDTVERQLKDTIREKPLTAIGAALAIGYIFAALTR